MTNLLGLELKQALERIKSEGTGEVLVTRYTAPRGKNTRGTFRMVNVDIKNRHLTVCAFNDSIAPEEIVQTPNDK